MTLYLNLRTDDLKSLREVHIYKNVIFCLFFFSFDIPTYYVMLSSYFFILLLMYKVTSLFMFNLMKIFISFMFS